MDRYEIRVAGHLDQRHAHALGCEELRLLPDGDSLLIFAAVDQAAVFGLLTRLRDAGLEGKHRPRSATKEPVHVEVICHGGRTEVPAAPSRTP